MTSETTKEEKTKQKPSKQTNEKKKQNILSFQIILSSEMVSTPACDYMKSTKHAEKQIESLVFFFFLFFFCCTDSLYTVPPIGESLPLLLLRNKITSAHFSAHPAVPLVASALCSTFLIGCIERVHAEQLQLRPRF